MPYQITYELQVGSQELDMDCKGCERQFDWVKMLLVYDKNDKYTTIYDSCNAGCLARMMQNIKLSNISDVYSATNTMKCDINNDTQKHSLWNQYNWKCLWQKSFADLRDSLGYPNEMERPSRNDSKSKLTIEVKKLLIKMRLDFWSYANGEFFTCCTREA